MKVRWRVRDLWFCPAPLVRARLAALPRSPPLAVHEWTSNRARRVQMPLGVTVTRKKDGVLHPREAQR